MQEAEGNLEEAEGGGSKLKEAEKGRKRHEGSLEEAEGGLRKVFQELLQTPPDFHSSLSAFRNQ